MNNIFTDSSEVEDLRKLIERKEKFFTEKPNKWLQEEIMLLKRLLSITLSETTLLYSEITKTLNQKIDEASQAGANVVSLIIPLHPIQDKLKIATWSPDGMKIPELEIIMRSTLKTEEVKL